jgi:hypothetical protein
MITYNASDIIKRAEQLADLENSDFISFAEKIALLNEAYQTIYQKGINKDVNAFVKYINTRDKVIQLPRDFYQLKAVTLGHDKDVKVIMRRPANASFNTLSYDMINNTLQINGELMGGTVCVEYYPVPVTLTFPNKNKPVSMNDALDIHGSTYIEYIDDDKISVKDLNDYDFSKVIQGTNVAHKLIHMEDDYITISDSITQTLYSLDTGDTTTESLPVVIYNNKTYLYDNTNKKLLLPVSHIVVEDLDIDLSNCTIAILSNDKTKYVGQNYNGGLFINCVHNDFNASKMFAYNDMVYLSNGSTYLAVYDFTNDRTENTLLDQAIVNIAEINDNTGYGYLGKRMNKYSLISFYDDTQLNFPNNTYFVFMSYLLALAFKSKQGSDTSLLAPMVEQAEMTFYDTMSRDDWSPTRITNVY